MTDVPFLFGALAASALPGPVIVEVMKHLGHRESATRNILVRLVDLRQLRPVKHGRVTVYELDGALHKYRAIAGAEATPWSGEFNCILYDIPETSRTVRDRLRHITESLGYGLLRPGVLITSQDRWDTASFLFDDLSKESWVLRTRMIPKDLTEARQLVSRAWDLESLAAAYHRATAAAQAPAPSDDGWELLLHLRRLYEIYFEAQLKDPDLPTELLPDDWPRDAFLQAQLRSNQQISAVLCPFLREQAAPYADLCRFYDPLAVPQ